MFIKVTDLNPLLIYDMTISELEILFDTKDKTAKAELEDKANIIRIAVSSAMSGKPIKLFEGETPKVKKGSLQDREEQLKALDDLGL